jgi:hypothetical protein
LNGSRCICSLRERGVAVDARCAPGITHGNKGEIIGLYNSPFWKLKCDELAKLKIERPQGLGTVLGTVIEECEESSEVTHLLNRRPIKSKR